jgi:hypothetical protein
VRVEAYDYRLYRQSELAALQDTLQLRLRRWLADWAPNAKITLTLTDLLTTDGEWLVDQAANIAMPNNEQVWDCFSRLCFDRDISRMQLPPASLCRSILTKALHSCLNALLKLTPPTISCVTLPASLRQTGALQLTLTIAESSLQLLLSAKHVLSLIDTPITSSTLPNFALSQLPLNDRVVLSVYLKPTQITLGELASIQVGDVIKLDHLSEQAFELRNQDEQVLGKAFPGIVNGCLQVRVCANQS